MNDEEHEPWYYRPATMWLWRILICGAVWLIARVILVLTDHLHVEVYWK